MAKQKSKPAKKAAKKSPAKTIKTKAVPKKAAPKKAAEKKVVVKKVKKIATKKVAAKKKGKKKSETLMCFLTTACVNYYSLPDNGYELNTLRNFRDSFLKSSLEGRRLVEHYYKVSPNLVKAIEQDREKKTIYAYIYRQIKTACSEIEKQHLELAKTVYTRMVKTLMKRYNPS